MRVRDVDELNDGIVGSTSREFVRAIGWHVGITLDGLLGMRTVAASFFFSVGTTWRGSLLFEEFTRYVSTTSDINMIVWVGIADVGFIPPTHPVFATGVINTASIFERRSPRQGVSILIKVNV